MKKRLIGIFLAILMVFSFLTLSVSAKSYIGVGKAKKIALKNAGKKKSEVSKLTARLDKDDEEYEVKFRTKTHKYEYDITEVKGKIHEKDIKLIKRVKSKGKKLIGKKKALKIALKNAGVKKKNAKGIEVELEKEKGVRFYDVEFRAGSKEYDYEIDAERKTILEKSVENIKYR